MNDEQKRISLGNILKDLLGSDNVYFQKPTNVQMSYPCFVYNLNDIPTNIANNKKYIRKISFIVTYISKNPDLEKIQEIHESRGFEFQRNYKADGLNHTVFKIIL